MAMHETDEGHTATRIRQGDEEAFIELYRRAQGRIYRFALHMSGSRSIAEDTVQEVFMRLVRNPAAYDPSRGSLPSYLLGIARNVIRHLGPGIPGNGRPLTAGEEAADGESRPEEETPHSRFSRNEMVRDVRRAVMLLPRRYREVVVLCELQELSCSETARIVGCREGTVKSRLHRGRILLARKLRAHGSPRLDCRTQNVARGVL